jgi:hypothetical protein
MKTFLFVILISYLLSSSVVVAQKAEIEQKLKEYGIPHGFFENNLNDENASHTYKTKTTTVTGTETKIEIGSFDPTLPEGKRWTLISVNGNEPTKKERKQFDKSHNKSDKSDFGEPNDEDWKIVKDDDEFLIIELRYMETNLPHKYKFLAGCKAEVFINKPGKRLTKIEFYNVDPLKIKIFNVSKLDMIISYRLEEGTDTYLIDQENILMDVRLLGQNVEVVETIDYYDYKKIR